MSSSRRDRVAESHSAWICPFVCPSVCKGRFQKKNPISWLGGSSMPRFSIKKRKTNMVLKHFILPEEHFKANLFFSHYDPP